MKNNKSLKKNHQQAKKNSESSRVATSNQALKQAGANLNSHPRDKSALQKKVVQTSAILMGLSFVLFMVSLISGQISSKSTDYKDFKSARSAFEKKYCKDDSWFISQSVSSSIRVTIDIDSSELLVANGTDCSKVHYTSVTHDIKKADKEPFHIVLSKYFPQLTRLDTLNAVQIAHLLNADTTYLAAIAADKQLPAEDVAFSLIYNTIIGEPIGHFAVTIENGRLVKKHLTQFAILKQNRFVKMMNMFSNSNSLDSIVISEAVEKDCRFVYWNVRNDKLYIGDEIYPVTDSFCKRYLSQIKSSPTEIFYVCGDELRTLQPTDYWGILDESAIQKAKKGFGTSLVEVLQSTSSLIILAVVFFGSCIFLIWKLARKSPSSVAEANTIEKVIITWNKNNDIMKHSETKLNDMNIEADQSNQQLPADENSMPEPEIPNINASREMQIGPNQFVFENFSCDEVGILSILEKIDSEKGSNMAEAFRNNQNECENLRRDKQNLQCEIQKKESEIAQLKNSLKKADAFQSEKRKESEAYKKLLSDKEKELESAVKKCGDAENNYKTVSNWMPYLEKTRQILSEIEAEIKKLPTHDVPNAWENLRIAILSHAALMKLLEVWTFDKAWQKKMNVSTFQAEMENEMLMLEKLKQSVNALCLKGNLNNSKDIDAEVKKKVQEGYDHSIVLTPNPRLDEILDKSIHARIVFEQNKPFMDAMWDNFVREFINGNPVQEGKAWYFEHLINIAYHAADFITMQQGQDKSLCYNYQFLESQFNPKNPAARPFEYQHAEKSSQKSNTIYEWTSEMGIEHLRVLIEKYFIKP